MKRRVLVTGANGQLAQTIKALYFKNDDHIIFIFVDKKTLDITDFKLVNHFFSQKIFDFCINCAAYTNVEQAEEFPELALKINTKAVKNLAKVCDKNKVTLIHISTDYVFDGEKTTPYLETDITNPINEYGKSKLKGELYILEVLKEHYIIRTSWLYSAYGNNFVKTIIKKIHENVDLKITTAETGTPTSCIDLAEIIYRIITVKNISYGTYHFSNQGEATWYDFAKEIINYFKDYNLDKLSRVSFFDTKANRPKYSVLDKSKYLNITSSKNKNWKTSLSEVLKNIKD